MMFEDKYLHSMSSTNSTEKSQHIYFKTVKEIISLSWQQNGFIRCTFIIIQEVQNVIFPLSKAYIFYTDFCFPCHSMPNFKRPKKKKTQQCYVCEMLRFSVDFHISSTMHVWMKKILSLNYRDEGCFVQIKYSSKYKVHVGWLFYHCLYLSVSHFILWLQILLVSQMHSLQVLDIKNAILLLSHFSHVVK